MNKKNHSTLPGSEQNQWFFTWFDTPFYHLLYDKRDLNEARTFISNLIAKLNPKPGSIALDLACGTGRHSIMLNNYGLNVLGIDLSSNSIAEAKKTENETLHFNVKDMREVILPLHFDFVFNLFTSFGYFGSFKDDLQVLDACYQELKPHGIMVLDYFNIEKVLPGLPYKGTETRGEIEFRVEKTFSDNHIYKKINFNHEAKEYHFEECVAAYTVNDFEQMFNAAGFTIKNTYGNYSLEKFDKNSERVIIIAEKNR